MAAPHRIAILGAGIGAEHVEGYLAVPGRYEIRVICDTNLERGQALASKLPNAVAVTAIDDVVGRADIDVIDICLPPFLHGTVAAQALAAGKHVVCEKPLCASLAEYDDLAAQAAAAHRRLLPVYQYRYGVGLQKLSRLIAAGVTGKLMVASLETHWNRGAAYYDNPWRGRFDTELGGVVVSHAVHMHDLLTTFLGPVRRVFARTATRVTDIETEDCAAISLELANGALVTHSITLGAADEISRMRLCFANLTAENDGHAPYDPGAEPWRFIPRGDGAQDRINAVLREFQPCPTRFAGFFNEVDGALADQHKAAALVAAGRQAIELTSAIYHSATHGGDVQLPLADDHPAYQSWARPTRVSVG